MVGERGVRRRSGLLNGGASVAVLMAGLACGLVSGCTGGGDEPAPWPSAGMVTSPSGSPSPSRSKAPEMPEAAKADTPAGAEAFARYALSLYGYTYQTGDTWPLKAIQGPDCSFCVSILDTVKIMREKNHLRTGGEIVVRDVVAVPNPPKGVYYLDVLVDGTASKEVDAAGKVVDTFDANTGQPLLVALRYNGLSWRLLDVANGDTSKS